MVEDIIAQYKKYLTGAQRKRLLQRAKTLSLMNAGERMKLVKQDTDRTKKTNTLLTDYGLATSLYRAPSSGEDALSRRQTAVTQGQGTLAAQEETTLTQTAKRMRAATERAREEAQKKKARSAKKNTPETGTETGQPGRTVTVRKI